METDPAKGKRGWFQNPFWCGCLLPLSLERLERLKIVIARSEARRLVRFRIGAIFLRKQSLNKISGTKHIDEYENQMVY